MASAQRRFRWGFVVLAAVVVVLAIWALTHRKKAAPPPKAGAVSVSVAKAILQDVAVRVEALGAAQAWQSATVRAQVSGKLVSVPAREGTDVAAGALLAEIDPAPFRALLTQAEGVLARDRALLQNARLDLARYRQLAAQDSIARQQVDTQAALVKQYEGVVAADEGAAATARINLGYCRITAPWAGRIGVRQVDAGNLVGASDASGLFILNQISPIAVTFTLPQGAFQRLSEASAGFSRPLAVKALSQETGAALGTGELTVVDNRVDPTTGTIQLKARFPNTDHRLWPGQFVNVSLTLRTLPQALTVPAGAVNHGPKGDFAYVVGADGKAASRPLTVAQTQDGVAVIGAGLKPGETVVIDGQMTLKPGMAVKPRPAAGASGK